MTASHSSPKLYRNTSAIADSGATSNFITATTPTTKIDHNIKNVQVKVANGSITSSRGHASLHMPTLPKQATQAYIMPSFPDSLISISKLCDAGLHCTFAPQSVLAFDPSTNDIKLQGWRDTASKLWRFPLGQERTNINTDSAQHSNSITANSAYDLPSVSALIKHHHASAGFPIKNTWCQAIKDGQLVAIVLMLMRQCLVQ